VFGSPGPAPHTVDDVPAVHDGNPQPSPDRSLNTHDAGALQDYVGGDTEAIEAVSGLREVDAPFAGADEGDVVVGLRADVVGVHPYLLVCPEQEVVVGSIRRILDGLDDCKIDASLVQPVGYLETLLDPDLHPDIRVGATEAGDDLSQSGGGHLFVATEANHAGEVGTLEAVDRIVMGGQNPFGVGQQVTSVSGECDTTAFTDQKRSIDSFLEAFDLPRDGALGYAETSGCRGKTFFVNDCKEGSEGLNVKSHSKIMTNRHNFVNTYE